jgi:hypothetical protein
MPVGTTSRTTLDDASRWKLGFIRMARIGPCSSIAQLPPRRRQATLGRKNAQERKKTLPRCPALAYTYWHDSEAEAAQGDGFVVAFPDRSSDS